MQALTCQGGRGRRGQTAAREVRRNGLQVEQVRDQEQRALSRSQSFFDAGPGLPVGRVILHPQCH